MCPLHNFYFFVKVSSAFDISRETHLDDIQYRAVFIQFKDSVMLHTKEANKCNQNFILYFPVQVILFGSVR